MKTKYVAIDEQDNIEEIRLYSQSFSGTDTSKESGKLGIIYPFDIGEDINNFVTVSSIIDHHNDDSHLLKHTEIRIANKIEDNLEYQLIDKSFSVVLHNKEESNKALNLFFRQDKYKHKFYCEVKNDVKNIAVMSDITDIYTKANTEVIVSDKVLSKKKYNAFIEEDNRYMSKKDENNIVSVFNKELKKLKINIKVDIDEIMTYFLKYESMPSYEKIIYNDFIEYMAYDIDSSIEETLNEYRDRMQYTPSSIFASGKKIREIIKERSLF